MYMKVHALPLQILGRHYPKSIADRGEPILINSQKRLENKCIVAIKSFKKWRKQINKCDLKEWLHCTNQTIIVFKIKWKKGIQFTVEK